jgi:hypothetical protein
MPFTKKIGADESAPTRDEEWMSEPSAVVNELTGCSDASACL